jgi:hypothetical protein
MAIGDLELSYLFDEYDPKGLAYIEYTELEKDFFDFVDYFNIHRP